MTTDLDNDLLAAARDRRDEVRGQRDRLRRQALAAVLAAEEIDAEYRKVDVAVATLESTKREDDFNDSAHLLG